MGFRKVSITLWPACPYEARGNSTDGTIGFAFDGQSGSDAIGSDRVRPFSRRPYTLAWIPPDCSVYSRSEVGGEYLVVEGVAPRLFLSESATTRALEQPVNDEVNRDAILAAKNLRRAIFSQTTVDQGDLSCWMDLLLIALEQRFTGRSGDSILWLTPYRLRKIDAYIESHMEEGLTVTDLANHLRLSRGFLFQAFRASLGVTPHAYLMDRRLARARRLLTGSKTAIAQIAAICGFAHQSHLTRSLTEAIGHPPKQLRNLY